jgi:hypothetical protein
MNLLAYLFESISVLGCSILVNTENSCWVNTSDKISSGSAIFPSIRIQLDVKFRTERLHGRTLILILCYTSIFWQQCCNNDNVNVSSSCLVFCVPRTVIHSAVSSNVIVRTLLTTLNANVTVESIRTWRRRTQGEIERQRTRLNAVKLSYHDSRIRSDKLRDRTLSRSG